MTHLYGELVHLMISAIFNDDGDEIIFFFRKLFSFTILRCLSDNNRA